MELLLVLALLACPVGMGAMMWSMGRNKNQDKNEQNAQNGQTAPAPVQATADELHDEHARLTAQIDQAEREQESGRARV